MHKTIAAVLMAAALFITALAHRTANAALAMLPVSVVDTNPQSGLIVGTAFPQISARFSAAASIDPTSVRLMVDDIDVTNVATITSAYVSYVPVSQMRNGSHSVSIVARTLDGTPLGDTWTFLVRSDSIPNYASPSWGYAPYGYPGYGFYPPGFALYAPGPIFFVAGGFVQVIFFSPFSPYGTGFVTIGGIPGHFFLTPWYGCPGYYWVTIPVPFGVYANSATLSAHFTMLSGRTVIVHSTTPLHIDGTQRVLPSDLRYANEPVFLRHPTSPQHVVEFVRAVPNTIAPRAAAPFTPLEPMQRFAPGPHPQPAWPIVHAIPARPVSPIAPAATEQAARMQVPVLSGAPSSSARLNDAHRFSDNGWDAGRTWSWPAPVQAAPFTAQHAPFTVQPAPVTVQPVPFTMPRAPIRPFGTHAGYGQH